jgi:putative tricarboxylic transport membrane protein
MRINDTIAGAFLITLALAVIGLTLSFPPFPGQKFGPSLFPRILSAALILCGVLLILRDQKSRARAPAFTIMPELRDRWRLVSFVLVLAAPLLAIFLWERVGFVPIAFVTLAAMFLWFRTRPATALWVAVVATIALQLFFGKMMRVPLPLGWLLNLPPGWLKYIT